jgi:hypothetical protein
MISLAKGLALTVSDLSGRGVYITSVMGGIESQRRPGADTRSDYPQRSGRHRYRRAGARITELDGANQRALIGSGRGKIEIVSVVGTVRIHG